LSDRNKSAGRRARIGDDYQRSLHIEVDHALFGYDEVLGERVLEEYEAESARWAPSAEKLRRETVALILAGPAPREAL
jgi:hypothetical protein